MSHNKRFHEMAEKIRGDDPNKTFNNIQLKNEWIKRHKEHCKHGGHK